MIALNLLTGMPGETNGANSPSRLDRLARIVEVFANTNAERQQDLEKLNAVIAGIKNIVRRIPPPAKQ